MGFLLFIQKESKACVLFISKHICAFFQENLILLFVSNKGTDQTAHPHSLNNNFVFFCLYES